MVAADAGRGTRPGVAAFLLLAFGLVACTIRCESHSLGRTRGLDALRPLLNSQRIEAVFGSYGVEVLEADDRFRLASLYSTGDDGRRVCRTLALTAFPAEIDPRVAAEHQAILGGASIGATFAQKGWRVEKMTRHIGEARAEKASRTARLMALEGRKELAAYAYTLVVSRNGARVDYATLVELYHPAFLRLGDLYDLLQGGAQPVPGEERPVDPEVARLLARLERELR